MRPSIRLAGNVTLTATMAYLTLASFVRRELSAGCLLVVVLIAYVVGNFVWIGVHI